MTHTYESKNLLNVNIIVFIRVYSFCINHMIRVIRVLAFVFHLRLATHSSPYLFYLCRSQKLSVRYFLFITSILSLICLSFVPRPKLVGDDLHVNQIQVIASHNSYHLRTDKAVLRFIKNLYHMGLLPRDLNPDELDYSHVPLTEQFDKYGIRGIELDVYYDPKGGLYYYRRTRGWVGLRSASRIEALKKPGYKMMHIPDVDYNSTNLTFKDGLAEVKRWSEAHPTHLPLFINVEVKQDAVGNHVPQLRRFAKALPFDSAAADALDAEVKDIFGADLKGVITPDRLRGDAATLEEVILSKGWPTLADARGKVMFIIDCDHTEHETYTKGHPSYRDRVMFTYTKPGTPEAAFVKLNDPSRHYKDIQEAVKKGYIIRTRCDEGANQARMGDYTDMNLAMSSWGQILSTDYYKPDDKAGTKGWSDYHVRFPQAGIARIDSISAPGRSGMIGE